MVDNKPSDSTATTKMKQGSTSGRVSREIIRRRHKGMPIGMYHLQEKLLDLTSTASFVDTLLILVAFITVASFLGFYPLTLLILIVIILFVTTLFRPFLGLIILTIAIFPIYMYQTPVLAWAFLVAAAAILIFGYKHYRLAVFTYALFGMAFSPLGYLFMIPLFIFMVLTIGNKRAIVTLTVAMLVIAMFSGVTGLQNTGYIVYNAQQAHTMLLASNPSAATVLAMDSLTKPTLTIFNFSVGLSSSVAAFTNFKVTSQVPGVGSVLIDAASSDILYYGIELLVLIGVVFAIDWYAGSSRKKFKGTYSSMFGVFYPLVYLALSGLHVSVADAAVLFVGFLIAPVVFYMLEYYDINVVKVLEVRKQDVRSRFGDAFEDLEGGNVSETFDDIGNYEYTKRELKETIISPIEEHGISQAYGIKPSKGILFFGPPGTGKTMMMRALANEIHGGFYYVKATNLISAYPGESERLIINIFSIAKKNAPCVLFFDEIDSLATSRENPGIDETHRHALAQLLSEMDGFQKVKGVIMVGATNRPDLLDKAILRPGRFDRIIYMPLPDVPGRKKIFDIYLSKLPAADDVNTKQLAEKTERYSGADIKAACESVAQLVAQEATSEHRILQITQTDMLNVIKSTKPSTSLSQLDEYRKFKLDFERSTSKGPEAQDKSAIDTDAVVGLDPAKKAIKEAVEIPLMHPELIKKYDIKTINGLLLFGPPGNGKTMLMRAVSNEMKGITMLEISGPELAQKGIEKTSETIKEIFNRAKENTPSVIFIDEIDGLVPRRDNASEFGAQITTELMNEIDGIKQLSNVVVIAATNRPDALDPALLRPGRFDKLIFVRPPNSTHRAEIFKQYLANVPTDKDIDFTKLGAETKGFTGADIAGICREAKTAALESELNTGAEGKIDMELLETLISKTRPSAPDGVVAQYAEFLAKYGQR